MEKNNPWACFIPTTRARECARMEQQLEEKKEESLAKSKMPGVLYFWEANVFSSVLPNDWWKKADLCNASRNVTVTWSNDCLQVKESLLLWTKKEWESLWKNFPRIEYCRFLDFSFNIIFCDFFRQIVKYLYCESSSWWTLFKIFIFEYCCTR